MTVKLNPTLLGREEVDAILHDALGYHEIKVPERAFAEDASWEDAAAMVERLGAYAAARGRSFGVKFSNTLVVENHKSFFPASEPLMYLSGPPLHPLAIALVARFRRAFGDRFPISFAGGVEATNFADTAALGLTPVTACSDLLKPSGYRRGWTYISDLVKRMDAVGAKDIDTFTLKAHGQAEAALAKLGLPEERSAACRAALAAGGDLRAAAGEAFAAWVSAARRAERRRLRRARDRRPVLQRRRERERRPTRSAARWFCSTASPATSASRSAPTTPTSSSPSRRERRRSSG